MGASEHGQKQVMEINQVIVARLWEAGKEEAYLAKVLLMYK